MKIYDDTYLYLCNLADSNEDISIKACISWHSHSFTHWRLNDAKIGKNIQGRLIDNRRTRLNQMEFMSHYI